MFSPASGISRFFGSGLFPEAKQSMISNVRGPCKAFLAVMTSQLSSHLSFPVPRFLTMEVFSCDGIPPLWVRLVLRDFSRRPTVAKSLRRKPAVLVFPTRFAEPVHPHGEVQSAQVIMDRDTGRSKGFGFVEMNDATQAQAAITALNGQEINAGRSPSTKLVPRRPGWRRWRRLARRGRRSFGRRRLRWRRWRRRWSSLLSRTKNTQRPSTTLVVDGRSFFYCLKSPHYGLSCCSDLMRPSWPNSGDPG